MTHASGIRHLRVLGGVDLRDHGGRELRSVLAQPKRLALLAYMAVAGADRFVRRDTLTSLFWPESNQDAARHSLRTSLHFLRRSLGDQVLVSRGQEELRLDGSTLWCDVTAFERGLTDGRLSSAMTLYRGHFLESFFVPDASPDLDLWLSQQRERMRTRAADAAATLAARAAQDANRDLAQHWAGRCIELAPYDEGTTRRVMTALSEAGDRAGSLRVYEAFVVRLSRDLDIDPSAETRHLANAVRRQDVVELPIAVTPTTGGLSSHGDVHHVKPAASGELLSGRRDTERRERKSSLVDWAIAGVLLLTIVSVALTRHSSSTTPVLAVGTIESRVVPNEGSTDPGGTLRDLIASDLARVQGMHVVSEARLVEVLGQLGVRRERPSDRTNAARRAGAGELLEGVLYRMGPERLRLDLRRVDLVNGVMRGSVSAEASDLFTLADSASAALGRVFGRTFPTAPIGKVGTTSLVARRFYEEGLRAYYNADLALALPMFRSALSEDSTFALAALYAARSTLATDPRTAADFMVRAKRGSSTLPDRERLLVEVGWAELTNDPSLVIIAESLATRYPTEPDGEYAWGKALGWSGDVVGSIVHLQLAVAKDSLSLGGKGLGCRACDALGAIVAGQTAQHSWSAAESTARNWVRRQPQSAWGWKVLAEFLERAGREYESLEASRRFVALIPSGSSALVWPRARLAIRAGRFIEADQLLNSQLGSERSTDFEAQWWRTISLRNQGRLDEALDVARRLNKLARAAGDATAPVAEAQVQFERGRFREAAQLFEEIAIASLKQPDTTSPLSSIGSRARNGSWYLTHMADALAADGDTGRLLTLADSIERLGALSAYGRDRRLHFYVRGLLAHARHQLTEAESLFRKAQVTPIAGFSRINLQLGKLLMERGRPSDAIEPLRAGLQFDLEASNFYVTHRELHQQLARAFRAFGLADSAKVHEAWGRP